MLSIENLHVAYGRSTALRGVSLTVSSGEAVALIGPNGAGKTTLLNTVAGSSRGSGRVLFEGEDLLGLKPEEILKKGIALVPERRRIFASLTVAENLRMGGASRSSREVGLGIEREMERFPVLRRKAASVAGKLSGGEQQQLAIARALMAEPRLLLLDEPSLGLSPQMVDIVFHTLESLRDEGRTVLLVEQIAMRSIRFADRTYVLRNGEVLMHGIESELLRDEAVVNAYLGM